MSAWKQALQMGLKVYGAEAMEALGRGLARVCLREGGCLALQGELGVGKTTLVRGIAAALGAGEITSPSFNYYLVYSEGRLPLIHVDAYRLKGPEEWESLMLQELVTQNTLLVVEWPERVRTALPMNALWLKIDEVEGEPQARKLQSIGRL